MDSYKATELRSGNNATGEYHFTITVNGETRPIGYCADPKYMCDHRSKEQASDCYRKYCIEQQNGVMAGIEMSKPYGWGEDLQIFI